MHHPLPVLDCTPNGLLYEGFTTCSNLLWCKHTIQYATLTAHFRLVVNEQGENNTNNWLYSVKCHQYFFCWSSSCHCQSNILGLLYVGPCKFLTGLHTHASESSARLQKMLYNLVSYWGGTTLVLSLQVQKFDIIEIGCIPCMWLCM